MKILLSNLPYVHNFIRSARSTWPSISGSNWYPIFLAYATGWLTKHGHQAKLVDALVDGSTPVDLVSLAKEFKQELLVVYVSAQSLASDIAIASRIKKITGGQLVLVGPWCAANPQNILKQYHTVDAVVRREFDDVLLDLANGKVKKEIKGLVFRQGEKIISNPERSFLTNAQLDQFPFVAQIYKEHLKIDKYYQASLLHPFVDLFTGRGCIWGKCTFCLWPFTIHRGAPLRLRSLENVLAELKYIQKNLPQVKEVFFQDDTLPIGRARELSELILKKNLKVAWSCYARANVDEETLRLMKEAGCRYLHVGYETASQTILNNINKGTNREEMKKFTQAARRAGLRIHGDFIIGLPGETVQTIRETIDWAKDLKIEGYQFLVPQPHAGTPLYTYLAKHKYLNHKGEINYPYLTHSALNCWRFKAMREIYLTPAYIFQTLKNIDSMDELKRLGRASLHVLPNMLFK